MFPPRMLTPSLRLSSRSCTCTRDSRVLVHGLATTFNPHGRVKNPTVLGVMVVLLAVLVQAQTVIRGPYLQTGTTTGVTVNWRTDTATDSAVRYGSEPGDLAQIATDAAQVTDHEVPISGLLPDTKYYYSVGTSIQELAGNNRNHFFVTSPPAGTAKPTRVWVLGDSGRANDDARAVREAYLHFNRNQSTDLWLMLGDNAYDHGKDSEYQKAVFDMYPHVLKNAVLWPTFGNHDGDLVADSATQTGPYYDIFSLPRNGEAGGEPSGTEAYYSFDYGNIHFVCLDSYESDLAPSGAMLNWLEADLQANDKPWVIAFWHHPPYTKGTHDSDSESDSDGLMVEVRENALPILEQYGVRPRADGPQPYVRTLAPD